MSSLLFQIAAVGLLMFGIGWLLYRWRNQRWVERVARTVLDRRRALYTELPAHRMLSDGELVDERERLDATSDALPGFRLIADYVSV